MRAERESRPASLQSFHYRGNAEGSSRPEGFTLLIGSVTTSTAITVGGLALMVLPTLIGGNELLILGGVGVAVGGWLLAHWHGKLQDIVDANNNGVDDRLETPTK